MQSTACNALDVESWKPQTRDELRDGIIADASLFLSTCCQVNDYHGRGLVPFGFNTAQRRYLNTIANPGVPRDVVAKARKWGYSTLRLGLGLHGVLYNPGRIFRVVAHRQKTSEFLGSIVKVFYESAWNFFHQVDGDPSWYMPRALTDSVLGYKFDNGSEIHLDTAGGKGVGQADRNDDLYLTEYADWERPEDSFARLSGSQPMGSPNNRLTVDFNAHSGWMGTDAYTIWKAANLDRSDADWNGFVPFFAGVLDCPEVYNPQDLEARRKSLGPRYPLSYPERAEDMYLQRDRSVHRLEDIDAAFQRTGGKYLLDVFPGWRGDCIHGVDTSTGSEEGDWQACVSFGWHDGIWWELEEPIHVRIPEDVFAGQVDERVRLRGGVCVVERNVGSAVLLRLRELETPIYKHKERTKDGKQRRQPGFPTTYASKRQMVAEGDKLLREGSLGLVSEKLRDEWADVEYMLDEDGKEKKGGGFAGAPERKGAHDDLWMSSLLALQGINYQPPSTWGA